MIWHSNSVTDVLQELCVDPEMGLTTQEATHRLDEYGHNRPQQPIRRPLLQEFMAQLRSPLTAALLAVSGVVCILGLYKQILQSVTTYWYVPLLVAALTIASAFLGAIRKKRAATLSEWANHLSAVDIRVLRDGIEQMVSTLSLVPGDIVLLCPGDTVPADCRLVTGENLKCDERVLTGVATPIAKYADAIYDNITPLAQRTNMVFAGTTIAEGSGTVVVVATGVRSEMGHEQHHQPQADHATKKKSDLFTTLSGVGAASLGILSLIIGLVGHHNRSAVLLIAATIAATLVPAGITALYTRLNANGIQRLLRHNVRVVNPATADALGRVDVVGIPQDMLCADDNVSLCRAYVGHHMVDLTQAQPKAPGLGLLLRMTALNTTENDLKDTAILTHLRKMGIDKDELLADMPRIGALSPANGRKTTIHIAEEQTLILVSGAWHSLLPLCSKGNIEEWSTAAAEMEQAGLQVVAVTYRLTDRAPTVHTAETLECDLVCAGLLGLHVPVHEGIVANSAVRTILFSADSADMASALAKHAGLSSAEAITAEHIAELKDDALAATVQRYDVYCGLDTTQKLRVLTALQAQKQVVAIATDRADEAELLSAADVGMARGVEAANIARVAADVILCKDNYATIITAVENGQRLRWEKRTLLIYLALYSVAVLFIGFGGVTSLCSLTYCALLLAGLNLLCAASPAPLLITFGISNAVQKIREK